MRVISGTRKSLQLKTLPGDATRPTTDRIKETLFNMLSPYIYGCRFLDIFAGSGGIGIEALSRGAECCCMIENNRKAAAVIKENLEKTRFTEQTVLICSDALKVLSKANNDEGYDVIFMDPPYEKGLEKAAVERLLGNGWASDGAIIIIEASAGTDFSWIKDLPLRYIKEKRYKTNKHIFLERIIRISENYG